MSELEGQMNELKTKWEQQDPPVKFAIAAVAAILALIVILKILPALVAVFGIGLFLVALFVPYWLPTIIAFMRKQPSRGGILALNFFAGWTFIGWVIAFVWALSDNSGASHTVIVNTTVGSAMSAAGGTPPPPPPAHRVGDVVNGHRFDGVSWVALQAPPPAPEDTPPPMVGSGQDG